MRKIISYLLIAVIMIALPMSFASAQGENLAKNGDFEIIGSTGDQPAGWTFNDYLNDGTTSKGFIQQDAERGNVVFIQNLAENDARFIQTIKVSPETVYMLSCYVKTENVVGGAGANIALESMICHSNAVTGTNDWMKVILVGKTGPDQKELEVGVRLGGYGETSTGSAWFDDFRIEKLDSYNGEIVDFFKTETSNNNNNNNNGSATVSEQDELEINARTKMVVIMLFVYIIAPIAIYFLLGFEHRNNKARQVPYKPSPAQTEPSIFDTKPILAKKTDAKLHYTRKDWIFVCALTLIYAVIAVTNLGSTKAPDSEWVGGVEEKITFVFEDDVRIDKIWQNGGIANGASYTLTGSNGQTVSFEQKYGTMYRWSSISKANQLGSTPLNSIELSVTQGKVWLNEIAFFDADGNLLKVGVTDESAIAVVDEQGYVPEYPNYMVGMYFDELYHARTAYEHINDLDVYEISHPPLGKIIISIGIRIFGMNPFGWRIMGAIFGIMMIPVMYAFGKRMFKRSELALLAAALLTFDFMHFTQTRIATIDVYGVFFNLCMTYYMYKFIKMDLGDSLKDTLKPLALSGLFFGIGCASKWICIYTGAALAVMFFAKMIVLFVKSSKIKKTKFTKEEMLEPAYENAINYPKRFVKTCLWCVLFFVIAPVIIYCTSYKPYWDAEWKEEAEAAKIDEMYLTGELSYGDPVPENVLDIGDFLKAYLEGVWGNQKYMYDYHSDLNATHSYQSSWYEWPLSNRPIWFYSGYQHPDDTKAGTIMSFGNPAVWWVCFIGALTLFIMFLRGRVKFNSDMLFIFSSMASTMLPWMLISRCVFIYHYFATVPLIILASVYVLKMYEDKYYYFDCGEGELLPRKYRGITRIKWVWIACAVVLFIVFYPVLTGIPVSKNYIDALQWLPTWTFRGIWH